MLLVFVMFFSFAKIDSACERAQGGDGDSGSPTVRDWQELPGDGMERREWVLGKRLGMKGLGR